MQAMSSPEAAADARGDDAGLRDPLLVNGNGAAHTVAAVTTANGQAEHNGKAAGASAAVSAKDRFWEDVDEPNVLVGQKGGADDIDGGRPLLFQKKKVKGIILHPYRLLIFIRMIAIILFFGWRIEHNNSDAMWLWAVSVTGDVWFGISWLLNQIPKLNPMKCVPDLAILRKEYDPPDGNSNLPGIDVFVTTADPIDEPILYTMNCLLSILSADYPVDKYSCYLSDDSGSLVLYEAMVEVAKFAELWVPFCRKHCIEPRAPRSYFELKAQKYAGTTLEGFVNDHRRVRREYDEFKVRIDTLSSKIRQRSDAYNSMTTKEGDIKATWKADGTQWPGTWIDPAENHMKGHHAGIVQIVLNHPSHAPQPGQPASVDHPLDFSSTDVRLPMLVYVSREKHPCYDHQKKAGALNAQLRASALLSNAPFVINFDCDHYINNSQAFRAAVCYMLDRREGDNTAFVQFPQRFDNIDPTDRYSNHNRVFFDSTMLALNGQQGPSYIGTGCMFRRVALYGFDPPRWRPDDMTIKAKRFGNSTSFLNSVSVAAIQERPISPPPLDESVVAEMMTVVSSAYDKGTEWGYRVGYIYDIATEDVVTGFRIHEQGWRSMLCELQPDAFRGTAPINLTERLYQIMRWSGGSLEMFFSHNSPLLAGHRLSLMQRIAYLNMTIYPVTSVFVVVYSLCPVMWLLPEEYYIQRPFVRYVIYLVVIIALVHLIGYFDMKWAGITWWDWWRNEQFFMITSTNAYPMVVLHMVVKLITKKGICFRVTSKQATPGGSTDKFADLYVVQWAPLLIPTLVVFSVNVGAIGIAMGKMVVYVGVWTSKQLTHAALGVLFNVWIIALLYPFALAIMGRWGKRPAILLIVLPIVFIVVGVMYVAVHFLLVGFVPFPVVWSKHAIFAWYY